MKTIPHDELGIWYVACPISECADMVFDARAIGCRHFDWLDSLREYIEVDDIIRVQLMSERDGGETNLEWGGEMEECKRELSCVCIKMTEAVGWQPGRPCRLHAPKLGE